MQFNCHPGFLMPDDEESAALIKKYERKTVELKSVGHGDSQHRAFFAYMKHDWKDNLLGKPGFETFDLYRARMCFAVGHVHVVRRKVSIETIYKMLEDLKKGIEEKRQYIEVETPRSMSQSECPAEEFRKLVEDITQLIFDRTGVSFADHIQKSKEYHAA